VEAIFKLYEGLKRQGPGSKRTTLHALDVIKENLPDSPKILDIGCGCGAQTLDLAENIDGNITAVDVYQPYLDHLLERSKSRNIIASIIILNKDMQNLSFPKSSFNLIWSEGAIYLMGMENGLKLWKNFLADSGFIAFSEISWFRDDPPEKLSRFWNANYPQLNTISQNLESIEKIGYKIIDHFSLSDDTWWENYYHPLLRKIEKIQHIPTMPQDMQEVIDETYEEIEIFREFSDWYGYEFYIIQLA
jgi:ubiquinone/menaquinone biosynthesis C-methylase UbiE